MRIRPASINYLVDASARHVYAKTLPDVVVETVKEEDRLVDENSEEEQEEQEQQEQRQQDLIASGSCNKDADVRSVHSSDFDFCFPYSDDDEESTVCFGPVVSTSQGAIEEVSPTTTPVVLVEDIGFKPTNEIVEPTTENEDMQVLVVEVTPMTLRILWFLYLNRRRKFLGNDDASTLTVDHDTPAAMLTTRALHHLYNESTPHSCKRRRTMDSSSRWEDRRVPSIPLSFLHVIEAIVSSTRRNRLGHQSPMMPRRLVQKRPMQQFSPQVDEAPQDTVDSSHTMASQPLHQDAAAASAAAAVASSHTTTLVSIVNTDGSQPSLLERAATSVSQLDTTTTPSGCNNRAPPNVVPPSVRHSAADELLVRRHLCSTDSSTLNKDAETRECRQSSSALLQGDSPRINVINQDSADKKAPPDSTSKASRALSPYASPGQLEEQGVEVPFDDGGESCGFPEPLVKSPIEVQQKISSPFAAADEMTHDHFEFPGDDDHEDNPDHFEFPGDDHEDTLDPAFEEERTSKKEAVAETKSAYRSEAKKHKKKKSKKSRKHKKKSKKRNRDSSSSVAEPRDSKRRGASRSSPDDNPHLSKITPETQRKIAISLQEAGDANAEAFFDPRVKPHRPSVGESTRVLADSTGNTEKIPPVRDHRSHVKTTTVDQRMPNSQRHQHPSQHFGQQPSPAVREHTNSELGTPEEGNGLEIPYESPEPVKRKRKTEVRPPETSKRTRKQQDEPQHVLCSESFIENSSQAAASLATGSWLTDTQRGSTGGNGPAPSITLHDSVLLDEIGVDIEIAGKGAMLVRRLSTWGKEQDLKVLIRELVKLTALGRYDNVHVIICVDIVVTPSLARDIAFVQGTPLGNTDCIVSFQMVAQSTSLAAAIAHRIADRTLRAKAKFGDDLDGSIFDALPHCYSQAAFLLRIASSLTATDAIQLLWDKERNVPRALRRVFEDLNSMVGSVTGTQLRLAALTQLNQVEGNQAGREI